MFVVSNENTTFVPRAKRFVCLRVSYHFSHNHKINMNKKEYIGHLANALVSNATTMTGENLAHHLNEIGFKTDFGRNGL